MKGSTRLIRDLTPGVAGDLVVTAVNHSLYSERHAGLYSNWRSYFDRFATATSAERVGEQLGRLRAFLAHCKTKSPYYREVLGNIDPTVATVESLVELPTLEKGTLLSELTQIATISKESAIVSRTGGTTGSSMEVFYDPQDVQERFAFIDQFRAGFGYQLGERIAWFTGKELISPADQMLGRVFKHDYRNRIRFFSTFHLSDSTFDRYWSALQKLRPRFLLGFPSFVLDLCVKARDRGLSMDGVTAYFPTAETVTDMHREAVQSVFGCSTYDQYAASEGAPFIIQCRAGRYHIQEHTGVFEVVDENLQPARTGELLLTSFSTRGTPLVRYRIGDCITLGPDGAKCDCGDGGRIVETIDGRRDDYLITPDGAKISGSNLGNSTKDADGIVMFQVQQTAADSILVLVVANERFDQQQQENFSRALMQRIGNRMKISIRRVAKIDREPSGKFRLVKKAN